MRRKESAANYPTRKPNRLRGHDYCQPAGYFVTICTANMVQLFGQIENYSMIPNQFGVVAINEWFLTSELRENVTLYQDEFVLMPNHLHGIIWIEESVENEINIKSKSEGFASNSLGAIICQFKTQTTKKINRLCNTPGKSIWQRNYYDHIIRGDKDLASIKKYILDNPLRWEEEKGLCFPKDR